MQDASFSLARGQLLLHLRPLDNVIGQKTVLMSDIQPANIPTTPPHNGLLHLVARILISGPSEGVAYYSARTIFKEYQFRALMKYASLSSRRILIADEAGLGKTVEAGYILAEELGQSPLSRVLVLCPASLKPKWRDELWNRFGLRFAVLSGKSLQKLFASDGSFWAIASYDLLKGKILPLTSNRKIDFLIIDEVHHLTGRGGETLRRKLGLRLSQASERVVALSATPIQLEFDDLRRVLEVVLARDINKNDFDKKIELVRYLNIISKFVSNKIDPRSSVHLGKVSEELSRRGISSDQSQSVEELLTSANEPILTGAIQNSKTELQSLLERMNPFRDVLVRNRRKEVGKWRRRIFTNPKVPPKTLP